MNEVIPADHVLIDGDGALVVVPDVPDTDWAMGTLDAGSDRPCDTCGHWDPDDLAVALCPDCDGTGRHTFDIEVAWQTEVDAYESDTLRVHVIDVLPPSAAAPGMWFVRLAVHAPENVDSST